MRRRNKKEVKPLVVINVIIGAVSAIAALISAIAALVETFK